MAKFRLEKLVRDKFVEIYIGLNQKPTYRILNPKERTKKLIEKLKEEVVELQNKGLTDLTEELADIQQVMDDLMENNNISKMSLLDAQKKKLKEKGGFKKGVYIETLELNEKDKWTAYYRKEPKRFPEIKQ